MREVQQKLIELGIVAEAESTARVEAIVKEQVGVLGPSVKAAGIKL